MKSACGILLLFLFASSSISYFKYERSLQPANSAGQHYVVVDETIWRYSRPDLADLRLYSMQKELPYAITFEFESPEAEQKSLRILQPGTIGGRTQFLLDMSGAAEYDRVKLTLSAQDFIAHARIEGQDDPHGTKWVTLGTTTLYDLSEEKLGHNSTLQIPLSAYKFLRVTVDGSIKPSDLVSATAGITRPEKVIWRDVDSRLAQEQKGRETIFTFSSPENVPVERVVFSIDPGPQNFSRSVEITEDNGQVIAVGEISRIHMLRNGQRIDTEDTSIGIHLAGAGRYQVIVRNGDDPPLKITSAKLQQYERRIYFDCDAGLLVQLYYGDAKLDAPVYDYRKFFQKDQAATLLRLEPEIRNAAYTGRPDDRPWSEHHPSILWAAIIAAVLLLGGIAFRSVKSQTT
ncbi:MAG TPA: DUF3999 family protein [Candidatus Acidoferrum sp.]|jgi:hypothetical protein